jgi:hypothetical protein
MARKKTARMPRGSRVRSGLKEPARGKRGLKPPRRKTKDAAAASFRMLEAWLMQTTRTDAYACSVFFQ